MQTASRLREQQNTAVLVDRDGTVVKRYTTVRQFGRIQFDGRWFAARRMTASAMPEHVYVEEPTDG